MDAIDTSLGYAFALVGVAIMIAAPFIHRRTAGKYADAKARWRQAEGEIVDAQVETKTFEDDDDDEMATFYTPSVQYRFDVDGRAYAGNTPIHGTTARFVSEIQSNAWLKKNAIGNRVPVWYDPDRPEANALGLQEPQALGLFIGLGVGLAVVLYGIGSAQGWF